MGGRRGATCPVCEKQFAQAYSLTIHLRIHNGEKPFACSTCGRRFTQAHSRTKHERTHTGQKDHECHVCGKRFGEAFMLKRHMRVHTGDKPFRCLECGRAFSDKFGLTRHLKTHVTVKAHPCSECGESFSNAWALATHQLQHMNVNPTCLDQSEFSGMPKRKHGDLGLVVTPEAAAILQAQAQAQATVQTQVPVSEQPIEIEIQLAPQDTNPAQDDLSVESKKPKLHVCLVCGKGYPDAWGLSKHSWVHTGIKAYSCSECGKGFGDKWGLSKHMRIHSTGEKPYDCYLCGQSYPDKTTLQSHLRVHTGEKPYICDLCGKCFAAVGALHEHRANHGDREQHTCPVCTRIFMTKRGVTEHWKRYCGKNNPNALENVTCVDTVTALCTVELKQDHEMPAGVNVTCSDFTVHQAPVAQTQAAVQAHVEAPVSAQVQAVVNAQVQAQVQAQIQAQVEAHVQAQQAQSQQLQGTPNTKEIWVPTSTWDATHILEVPTSTTVKLESKIVPCYMCDVCHKIFKQIALLEKHKLSEHPGSCNKSKDEPSSSGQSQSESQHICTACSKTFATPSCLKTHLEAGSCHQKNCAICGKALRVLTVEGAQIITPYCDTCSLTQQYDSRGDLIIPKRTGVSAWPFDTAHLTFHKHRILHSDGTKPCSCGNCHGDGMFPSHTAISTHSLTAPTAGV